MNKRQRKKARRIRVQKVLRRKDSQRRNRRHRHMLGVSDKEYNLMVSTAQQIPDKSMIGRHVTLEKLQLELARQNGIPPQYVDGNLRSLHTRCFYD